MKYLFEEDNVVLEKYVKAGTQKKLVRLFYYPTKYDDRYQNEKIVMRKEEWVVEVELGAFYREHFGSNEKSARWSYDLINVNFIASVIVWHQMKKDTNEYRKNTLEIHSTKVFNGRDTDEVDSS